jgi:ribonuclease-3 family protein
MENLFHTQCTPQQVNGITNLGLAHIGDAAYELLVRTWLCTRGDRTVLKLHKDSVELVKATTQAKLVQELLPHLTEEEYAYYRRGKNAHVHVPKSASHQEYSMATGLETLFGALYLAGQTQRLNELFHILMAARAAD